MSDHNDELSYIARNASDIRKKISAAARACGRNEDDITVVAAVKYADSAEINYLHSVCGINNIGENRVQQLTERYDALDKSNLSVHFIGKLQTNKVK